MFIGSFLGCSIDATLLDTGTTEYIEIENAIFDEVYMDSDVDEAYDMKIPEWGYSTIMNAKFKNNLLAGNVDFTLDSISDMRIKKRKRGSYKWTTIHNVPIIDEDSFDFFYNDFIVASNTVYEYAAIPIINGVEGTYQIVDCAVDFEGAFVSDINNTYHVYLNMSCDSTTRAIAATVVEPVGSKYPYVYYHSMQQYDRFPLSGLFVERISCDEWDIDNGWRYRKALRDFASNRLTKIVRFYDGRIYMAASADQVNEATNGHPDFVISTLQFVEIGDPESNYDLYYHGFANFLEVGV